MIPFEQAVTLVDVSKRDSRIEMQGLGIGKSHAIEKRSTIIADLKRFAAREFPGESAKNVTRFGYELVERGEKFLAPSAI